VMIPGWLIYLLAVGALVWAVETFALMRAASRDRQRADYYHSLVVGEINRSMQQACSLGPRETAKTLQEDELQ